MIEDVVVKIKFGSHLYGTATEKSDTDYKGVFLPTLEEILLNRIPKSYNFKTKTKNIGKNTAEDVDCEFYSLHYFIELACQGETVALDMLHAPENMIEQKIGLWDEIVSQREKFYTKNLSAFVGYARRQASKYGIKGSRLDTCKALIAFLVDNSDPCRDVRLEEIWERIPVLEHTQKYVNVNGLREMEVCGRKIQETQSTTYAMDIIERYYKKYGERAKLAAENKDIDWKAVSHALRAAFQVEQILTEGTITFPLKQAPYLLDVKNGKLDYLTEVAPKLENLMSRLEELSIKSKLPEKVDRFYWNSFLFSMLKLMHGIYR